eukprot:352084-Chlamydomonas_euryale.AAC.6
MRDGLRAGSCVRAQRHSLVHARGDCVLAVHARLHASLRTVVLVCVSDRLAFCPTRGQLASAVSSQTRS